VNDSKLVTWIIDSGCLHHMINDIFVSFKSFQIPEVIRSANDSRIHAYAQIAKPAETDFEQNMLSMFDNKKATNLTQCL